MNLLLRDLVYQMQFIHVFYIFTSALSLLYLINLMTNNSIISKVNIFLLNYYLFISWNMCDMKEQFMSE